MVESLHGIPDYALSRSREELAGELIDTLLKGLEYRKGGTSPKVVELTGDHSTTCSARPGWTPCAA